MLARCRYVLCPCTQTQQVGNENPVYHVTPTQDSGVPMHLGIGPVVPQVGGTFVARLTPGGRARNLRCVTVRRADSPGNDLPVPVVFYERA